MARLPGRGGRLWEDSATIHLQEGNELTKFAGTCLASGIGPQSWRTAAEKNRETGGILFFGSGRMAPGVTIYLGMNTVTRKPNNVIWRVYKTEKL